MDVVGMSPDSGHSSGLLAAVAQVLGPDDEVAGAGFLVTDDILVTCAHVVHAAGCGPGETIRLAFPHMEGTPQVEGQVLAEPWRAPEDDDVAVVRLSGIPEGVTALPLGSAAGCRGHRVRSFGFPVQAPPGGHFGFGVAGGLLPSPDGAGVLVQLTSANDLTTGFSGGPVLDEVTGLVIGMVTAITAPDAHDRGRGIAYATSTQTLRQIWPGLAAQDVRPYRGLEPFTTADAGWFHGRHRATGKVLAALRVSTGRGCTLLLGPSGAGKSSLVQAGLLPALTRGAVAGSDRWLTVTARPGRDLFTELAAAGLPDAETGGITAAAKRRLAATPDHDHLLLILDPLEELLANSPRRRDALQRLTHAVTAPHPTVSLLLVMRDDFYPRLAELAPQLLDAAVPGTVNISDALDREDLHAIITRPAHTAGAAFADGLPDHLITDLFNADSATGPGVRVTLLPLLQLTLDQLWQRRQDGRLTHDAYQHIGTVTGALTTWCHTALSDLTPPQHDTAQRILIALVRPADDTHHTPAARQQRPLSVLRDLTTPRPASGQPRPTGDTGPDTVHETAADTDFDAVLATLTRHRIITTRHPGTTGRTSITTAEPVAELIHDALIRDWPDLRDWVAQDHRFQVWLHRAGEQQAQHAQGGLPGDLLDGTALAEGMDWARQRPLPADITTFLTASQQHQQAAVRRTRRINTVLVGMLVLALIGGALAFWQRQTALAAQRQALSRQLAAQSTNLLTTDADLASLLAIHAYRISPTAEATASLEDAAGFPLQGSFTAGAPVHSVAFNSEDNRILAIGSDKGVQLRNVTTGNILHILTHTGFVNSLAFKRDGRVLAIGSDKGVQLRSVTTGNILRTPIVGENARSVTFSPDGQTLATTSDVHGGVRLWEVTTGKRLRVFPNASNVDSGAFSPDGHTLATTSDGKDGAQLWEVASGKPLRGFPTGGEEVYSVALSPDGRTLAATSDTIGRLWDTATGQIRATFPTTGLVAMVFSPDGHTLATSGNTGAQLWDLTTDQVRTTLTTSPGSSVAFSPDGRTLVTGNDDSNGTVQLWDATAGQARTALPHTRFSWVGFAPDGRTLATSDFGSPARLWDASTGKIRATLTVPDDPHDLVRGPVVFSPDRRTLATSGADNKVRLWDASTGALQTSLAPDAHSADVPWSQMAFSPDGHTLATVGAKCVQLWDTTTHKPRNLPGTSTADDVVFSPKNSRVLAIVGAKGVQLWDTTTHKPRNLPGTSTANSVDFSPDGRTLATLVGAAVSGKGVVQLWDTATGQSRNLAGTSAANSVTFSPDGRTLATLARDEGVQLSDTATGQSQNLAGTSAANWMTFSPDGRTLATSISGEGVQLWDTATDHVRTTLLDTKSVNRVVFSPDGHTLATTSDDGVRLWDVSLPNPAEAIQKICKVVHRDLTPREWSRYLPGQSPSPVCTS
ncbi:MAG: PD40 domain-containing protein [Streptomycetaceae bacterium]|nr:PD40 domain-containing protein [Streptomycetaceae bacterium]